jgi:glycosyltransferase involved in cell wall biosynthesis
LTISISYLPTVDDGKHGWPWTSDTPDSEADFDDSLDWPRITVVTGTYNQGPFIEETIRSVALQGYPNLEYMIFDGGSTDETVAIIEKYDGVIDYWESKSDRGHGHAVNKGYGRATGDIVASLNSDDIYTPGALLRVGKAFMDSPGCASVSGKMRLETLNHETINVKRPQPFDPEHYFRGGMNPGHPAVFLSKSTINSVGPVDESMDTSWDRDYWIRLGLRLPEAVHIEVPEELAIARLWSGNQGSIWKGNAELIDSHEIFRAHLSILEKSFRSEEITPAQMKLRRGAYSIEMMRYATNCAAGHKRVEAARYGLLSSLKDPSMIMQKTFWALWKNIVKLG